MCVHFERVHVGGGFSNGGKKGGALEQCLVLEDEDDMTDSRNVVERNSIVHVGSETSHVETSFTDVRHSELKTLQCKLGLSSSTIVNNDEEAVAQQR